MRKNKTLLKDLTDVYYSLRCDDVNNEGYIGCRFCKNKDICLPIIKLISSIENLY